MSKLSRFASILAPAFLVLSVIGIDAYALTVPATFSPRNFNTQQIGYFRVHAKIIGAGVINVNNSTCSAPTSGSNCSVKFGTLPANAFLLRQTQQIVTNFNAQATDLVGVGSTTAGVNIKASATVHTGAGAISSPAFVAGSSGTLLTTGVAQTGGAGGYDLYMNYTWGGSSAATAGEVVYVLEYAGPNDGSCVATPLGETPVAC